MKDKKDGDSYIFSISCVATNNYGSREGSIAPYYSSNAGGCPWLLVETAPDEGVQIYSEENNILNQSQFAGNIGNDITDLYKIKTEPYINYDGDQPLVNCNIVESNNHYSYFDRVKLYAIDHQWGTKVVIGNDNNIYVYDETSVKSSKSAYLDGTIDVTDEIQYGFDSYTTSDSLDYISAEYSHATYYVPGIIAGLDGDRLTPILNKNIAADLDVNSGEYSFPLAMRERQYEVTSIISGPFQTYTVEDVAVNYLRHAMVSYIIVAEMTTNYDQYELPLYSAVHSGYGDLTLLMTNVDQQYCEMDSLNNIKLSFNAGNLPELEDGNIRDYVFEVTGRYCDTIPDGHFNNMFYNISNNSDNKSIIVNNYKLYTNYPNPFNPKTLISYDIVDKGIVKIVIYNILGQEVNTLVNEYKLPGHYSIEFNGSNLASGVYL